MYIILTRQLFLIGLRPTTALLLFVLLWVLAQSTGNFILLWSVIIFFALLGIGTYRVILTGWSSSRSFSKLGRLRAILQSLSFEVVLVIVVLMVLTINRALSLSFELKLRERLMLWLCFWLFLLLIEGNRAPFDLLERERELISGFNIEIGRISFIYLFLREYGIIMIFSSIAGNFVTGSTLITSVLMVTLVLIIRNCYPRLRYDSFIEIIWQRILPLRVLLFIVSIFNCSYDVWAFSFFKGKEIESWQLSHLVDRSWIPLCLSASVFLLIFSTLFWFKFGIFPLLFLSSLLLLISLFVTWFRDISRERTYYGKHSLIVQSGLKWGLVWFLFREVWFFFRVFWTFFHFRLSPLSGAFWAWPFEGVIVIPFFQIPLLNTLILLSRGLTATLGHQELLKREKSPWVLYRVLLGVYFLSLQGIEYLVSSISISSRIYGRVFFFGTGFHGLHVFLGTFMLLTRRTRLSLTIISSLHHFGVEFSLWYWHFVDAVWLFLFFWIYTWGS